MAIINVPADYPTIQAAINAANPGDTIEVAAGVYNESITINKPLTLLGPQANVDARTRPGVPANEAIIVGPGGDTPVDVTASNVVINGFTIQGATNSSQFGTGILIGAGTSRTQILNNIIQNNITGLELANANSIYGSTVISQNLFQNNNAPGPLSGTAIYSDQFVAGGSLNDVSITDNAFSGNDNAGVDLGFTSGASSGISVENNSFSSDANAIFLSDVSDVTVSGNTSDGSTGAAILLGGGDSNVGITQNQIENSQAQGVWLTNEPGLGLSPNSNVSVTNNSIANNTGLGLEVDAGGLAAGQTVQASGNWWGSANLSAVQAEMSGPVSFSGFRASDANAAPTVPGFQPTAPLILVVTTLADEDNPGATQSDPGGTGLSLREALTIADADASNAYIIQFAVAGTISLTSALPTVTNNVTIDGTSAPGYAGSPVVTIDGTGAGANADGLDFEAGASNSAVEGLDIVNFSGAGIDLIGVTGVAITGNYIGVDQSGDAAAANGTGIELQVGADDNTIGSATAGDGNVISGNTGDGIELQQGPADNSVIGNLIGLDAAGTAALGNGGNGITITVSHDNTIGGTATGAGNAIADNAGAGVAITEGTGNAIEGNAISQNAVGIEFAGNANDMQAFPVLSVVQTSATQIEIAGTLDSTANQTYRIEFFASSSADMNGNVEGATFLGSTNVTTNGSGTATFDSTQSWAIAQGELVTATATNVTTGDTSEFSQAFTADGSLVVTNLHDGGAGSLRAAIMAANAAGGSNTITFDPSLAGGTLALTSGALDITSNITIDGTFSANGTPDITINAGRNSQVFDVSAGSSALEGLSLTGGYSPTAGGGVYVASGAALTVTDSKVFGNSTESFGGGIDALGTLTLIDSTLSHNSAGLAGGGVYGDGTLTLVNSTLSDNNTYGGGGGIADNGGALTLTNVTLTGNGAYDGGGIGVLNGALTLYDSTLTGNYASKSGGGIYNSGTRSTTLVNSIVAGNYAGASESDLYGSAPLTLTGGNIVGDTLSVDGTTSQTGIGLSDIFASVATNPLTGASYAALGSNGGPVQTVALNPTGVAINTGVAADLPPDPNSPAEPLSVDARGLARVVNGGLDLGAFQQQTPQTFVVTTLDDISASNPNPNDLSLREALFLANEDPTTGDTITFASNLAGGTIDLTLGQLKIDGDVTINGGTNNITIDAQNSSRVFDAVYGTSTINSLTITGGSALGYAAGDGGAIQVGSSKGYGGANLTISNSTITGSQAAYGGGIAVNAGDSLELTNDTVSGNSAILVGGGIANQGTLTLTNSTVENNSAGYIGGGIASDNTLTVIGSTLSGNQIAGSGGVIPPGYSFGGGGGLYNSGSAALLNTTISGNTSSYSGGGIYNSRDLTLTNVTIADNSAYNGGGLSNAECGCGNVSIYDATITGNDASHSGGGIYNAAGSVALTNSIVAGNGAGDQGTDIAGAGTTRYSGVNLFSQSGVGRAGTDIYVSPSDLSAVFAGLTTITPTSGGQFQGGTLANNGGTVQTVLITEGGLAQETGDVAALPPDTDDLNNNGNTTEPLPVDARGDPRVVDGTVDIGAVELQSPPTPVVTAVSSNVNATASQSFTAAQLFAASDAAGEPILTYEVKDESSGPNQGFWVLNGAVLTNGQITTLTAAQLAQLSFVAGSAGAPVTDTLEVAASDAAGLGAFAGFTVTASAHASTAAPIVTAANELQAPGLTLAASSLFSGTAFGGNSIVSYEVEDTTPDSGHWIFNGTIEPTNQVIDVTVAQLAQLSFETGYGSDTLTVRANDGSQWGSLVSFTVTPPPNAAPPAGTTDTLVMLRNANGAIEFYDIGRNQVLLDGPLGQINPTLQVAGVGGFDGSDTADLLMRDPTTGAFTLYDVSNNNITGNVALGQVGPEWTVAGFGDFSGHAGETDMVMRNANTGAFELYDISHNTVTSAAPLGQVGLEWQVAGFGDFSGNPDGSGMLLRNANTGAFEVYDITNNTVTSATGMGQVGTEWQVAGFGDFSGNADETDMLMRNSNTGAFEVYDIVNNAVTSATSMGQVGLEWTVAGFGDFSGNANETDMLMRNANTGAFELYDISRNTVTAATGIGQVGTEWSVSGVSADPASAPPSSATAQLTQAMASFAPAAGTAAASLSLNQAMATPAISPLLTTNHA